MKQPVQVIVVDDEPKLRALWERVLANQTEFKLVDLLDSADEICAKAPAGPSVVLMDLSMPGCDPLEAIAKLRSMRPDCRVVVYSGHNAEETVDAAMDAGAWGFVDKLSRLSDIMDAMRRVAHGETVFP